MVTESQINRQINLNECSSSDYDSEYESEEEGDNVDDMPIQHPFNRSSEASGGSQNFSNGTTVFSPDTIRRASLNRRVSLEISPEVRKM